MGVLASFKYLTILKIVLKGPDLCRIFKMVCLQVNKHKLGTCRPLKFGLIGIPSEIFLCMKGINIIVLSLDQK